MSVFVSNAKITGGQVMSASTFLELLDTPAVYLGEAGKIANPVPQPVRVGPAPRDENGNLIRQGS